MDAQTRPVVYRSKFELLAASASDDPPDPKKRASSCSACILGLLLSVNCSYRLLPFEIDVNRHPGEHTQDRY